MTSDAWCMRTKARLVPTTAASPNHSGADFLPSSVVSTVAANTAALACPLGKLLVDGVRTAKRSSPLVVGRSRLKIRLTP